VTVDVQVENRSGWAVDEPAAVAAVRAALAEEGVTEGELGLALVDPLEMTRLNADHRGKDAPTDVLSFPMDDELPPAGRQPDQGGRGPGSPSDPGDPPTVLGDVVVCPLVASRQAAERGGALDDELALLVVHGVLHLLNYDHAEPAETAAMQKRERELLAQFRDERTASPEEGQ